MRAPLFTFHAVDRRHWRDMDKFFSARGSPNWCWCMVWRKGERKGKAERRKSLEAYVERGEPIGILAYQDGAPVAWCSIGPRASYRALGGTAAADETSAWSIVCFFAAREVRGADISAKLLKAAIAEARQHGAKIVEAYPVDEDSASYRYMGQVRLFERAGFKHVGMAGSKRHVMRKVV